MAVRASQRHSGTYISFGSDEPQLIRLPPELRRRADGLRDRFIARADRKVPRGPFLAAVVGLGIDAKMGRKPRRIRDLNDLLAEPHRPLQQEARALYEEAYRDSPGPGFGQWVSHLIELGLERLPQT